MNVLQNIAVIGGQGNLFADGLATLVVGIGVVFVALILLIVILELMGKVFDSISKQDEAKAASAQVVSIPEQVEPASAQGSQSDDLELVAVISAAIAASMGTSVDGFQVRSIRRTNNVWGTSSRTEQIYN